MDTFNEWTPTPGQDKLEKSSLRLNDVIKTQEYKQEFNGPLVMAIYDLDKRKEKAIVKIK